jgi:hypothetical protein
MKWTLLLALVASCALTAQAHSALPCFCQTKCIVPPEPACRDCTCPCEHRLSLTPFGSAHAQKLILDLQSENSCERELAATKLGCRLHADFCADPDVLTALIGALQCDTCWEVRRTAAWAIFRQDARVDEAILALYVSSKIDPHYMVRSRAAEALDILIVGRKECYRNLLKCGDKLIVELKARGVKPGSGNCRVLYNDACHSCGLDGTAPPPMAPELIPGPTKEASEPGEAIPAPTKEAPTPQKVPK